MKIHILTPQHGFNRGPCDFYPVIKWKKYISKQGYSISFYSSHIQKGLSDCDIFLLDHRYYDLLIKYDDKYKDKDFIIDFINKLKSKAIKVILFDNDDGAGSSQFDIIEHVDLFVKKQILKDKYQYCIDRGFRNKMVFVGDYDLSEKQLIHNEKYAYESVPCPEDQIHKIKLGWNIGLLDYRYFPFSRYYPFGTARLLNSVYKNPMFTEVDKSRNIDAVYRGGFLDFSENYSWQRQELIKFFNSQNKYNLITGNTVNKRQYINELRASKVCVSPFGWGEVCYRDFEAAMCGCVMIKPDMSHIVTYPDIYIKDVTYVDVKWNLKDLETKIDSVLQNYDDHKKLAEKAQKVYREEINNPEKFASKFIDLLNFK